MWGFRTVRRLGNTFAEGDAQMEFVETTPVAGEAKGTLLLSFDGRDFDGWEAALGLFERHGAHATFFICGELDNAAVKKCKLFREKGHSVGIAAADGADLATKKRACDVGYIPVVAFTCPDPLPLDGFERMRGVAEGSGNRDNDAAFFPAAELPARRRIDTIFVAEECQAGIEAVLGCLERAAERREVVSLTARGIFGDGGKPDMRTEWLEAILEKANELGLATVGFDELPPPK